MNREEYQELVQPAISAAMDHFISNEEQYGEGLNYTHKDIIKCASHAISATKGEHNPDGVSHAVAALSRALKAVMLEIEGGNS